MTDMTLAEFRKYRKTAEQLILEELQALEKYGVTIKDVDHSYTQTIGGPYMRVATVTLRVEV